MIGGKKMQKLVCIVTKRIKVNGATKEIFCLMEKIMGKFNYIDRDGIISESEDLSVLADSIFKINEITGDSVAITFTLPENFDSEKYSTLSPTTKLVLREKLGLTPN